MAMLTGLAMLMATDSARAINTSISGVSGALATNISNWLEPVSIPDQADPEEQTPDVRNRVNEALQALGYYDADFTLEFHDRQHVDVTVKKGEPVRVSTLDIQLLGDAKNDAPFRKAIDDSALSRMKGKVLHHADYDALKSQLSALALERGYFDADFRASRIEVRPWQHSARIYLVFDGRRRYRFGDISFNGNQIRAERLRRMAPFEPGDFYDANLIASYNQRLSSSNWFRSIGVQPQLDDSGAQAPSPDAQVMSSDNNADDNHDSRSSGNALLSNKGRAGARKSSTPATNASHTSTTDMVRSSDFYHDIATQQPQRVPINVDLIPADRYQFETGIGYATDVGPRVRFSLDMPWLNNRGDSLTNDLTLSGPEQEFSGKYEHPLDDPLSGNYNIRYGFSKTDLDSSDTNSFESSIQFGRQWTFDNGWTQDAYIRTTYEDFTQGNDSGEALLFVPGMSWSRSQTDNANFPMHGNRQDILIEASDKHWGSDVTFARTRFDTQWIRSLGNNNRFVARGTVGATATSDFHDMPPSLRFFAGGDRSVRGYKYNGLSPEDSDGDQLGGPHLLVGSLEYQRRVVGQWWGATFFDIGNAFDDWLPNNLKKSVGAGVRWISPVGPVRLDIAHPLDDKDTSWRLHFGIGPEI